MANRPANSRITNVINWGIDKRIPLGFVDTVIDKETGNLIGFMQDGEFYELGAKPKKTAKAPEPPVVSGLTAADINAGIPGGGVDPRRAAAYLNSSDPRLSEAAQKIILAQTAGLMDLDGNVADTALSRREESDRLQAAADQKFTENIEQETVAKKKKANQEAAQGGYQVPYPDLEKTAKTTPKSTATATPVTGGNSGIPATKTQPTYTGDRQGTAASAAALGLSASSLTRPSTAVEKIAKEAASANGKVTPKTKSKGKVTPALTDAQDRDQALAAAAANADFSLPETLFNNIDELTELLDDYVKSDKNGGQWTLDTFRQKFRNTNWYKNNSVEIKNRYVQLYNYNDQKKGGQDVSNTQYAKEISTLERRIADKARAMGSDIASDPDALRRTAEDFYITNVGIDDAIATDLIASRIRPITSTLGGKGTQTYSGQALKDYQEIQNIARANGFRVKDIIPGGFNERQVLEGIATGKLDANRIAQDTRILAQQGQPQYVRDLLSQGYNLDQVFAPYRQTMANLLEINADQIDLNDSTLRSAISDKGDMNIYDFKKTLKKDSRWQYTENAKQEVSDITLKILRDFGLQG